MNATTAEGPHTGSSLSDDNDIRIRGTFPMELTSSPIRSPFTEASGGYDGSGSSPLLAPAHEKYGPGHHATKGDDDDTSEMDFSPRTPERANWGCLRVEIPEVYEEDENSVSQIFTTFPRLQHGNRSIPSKLWGRKSCQINHGQELDDNAPVWKAYQDEATKHDQTMIDGWSGDMDILLVFVRDIHYVPGKVSCCYLLGWPLFCSPHILHHRILQTVTA